MHPGIQSWRNLLKFLLYYFSIPQLLGSLFAPWHSDRFQSESDSAIERFVERVAFGLIVRIIGFIARSLTIVVGTLALLGTVLLFPLFAVMPIQLRYEQLVKKGSVGKTWSFKQTFFLNRHGRDLRNAPERYLPPSRQNILQQMERILVRESKGNVMLIANEGVGKTAFLEQFAKRVHWGLIDPRLDFKRVVQLIPDEMSVDDLERAFKEAVKAKNIILVIEGIHLYDARVLRTLLPYLDVNKFDVILTTTPGAFDEIYKNNQELMRVAEPIDLTEPTDEEMVDILHDYLGDLGTKNEVNNEVLEELIKLTDKYVIRASQPAKAIDVIDTILASRMPLSVESVEQIVSDKSNVPLGAMERDEAALLLQLSEIMQNEIIGQEEAVQDVVEALKRSRSGVGNPDRPIGVFLFLGPTGVGKTHTAQTLAKHYFGNKEAMIRFDMSEFRELETLDRFVERATVAIENQPFSLFFVDEIEKAHPDILNLFLQVFDEGRLTGADGVTVSFDSSIIICTSNAGSAKIQEDINIQKAVLVEYLIAEGMFRPEFLNRFDAITLFKPLTAEQVQSVTKLMLQSLVDRIYEEKKIRVELTPELIARVAENGFDPNFGARPIRRAMQEIVENELADSILRGEVAEGGTIRL